MARGNNTVKNMMSLENGIVIFLVLVLIGLVYMYIRNSRENFQDVHVKNLVFYYVDWCPHCKDAKPVFNQLAEKIKNNNGKHNGKPVHLELVNCEENAERAEKAGIRGYPSVLIESNDPNHKSEELDQGISIETLENFLDKHLN